MDTLSQSLETPGAARVKAAACRCLVFLEVASIINSYCWWKCQCTGADPEPSTGPDVFTLEVPQAGQYTDSNLSTLDRRQFHAVTAAADPAGFHIPAAAGWLAANLVLRIVVGSVNGLRNARRSRFRSPLRRAERRTYPNSAAGNIGIRVELREGRRRHRRRDSARGKRH